MWLANIAQDPSCLQQQTSKDNNDHFVSLHQIKIAYRGGHGIALIFVWAMTIIDIHENLEFQVFLLRFNKPFDNHGPKSLRICFDWLTT